MADVYYIWRLAEAAQQIDLLAGFLATRQEQGPDARRDAADRAGAGRAAVAAGRLGEALDHVEELRERAARWAGHSPHPGEPGEPGAAEHDARIWDYAKDMLRAELEPPRTDLATARRILENLRFLQRQICARPEADAQARADAHYLAGRGAMAVELGRSGAARKELRRLRALAERYAGTGVT